MSESILYIQGGDPARLTKPLVGFKADIETRLDDFPFENNVFIMMKYRRSNKALSDFMIETLAEKGFRGVRADDPDWNITGNVYNPLAALYCCKYGIALFDEAEEGQSYSANVAYELGIMHYQRKSCLILRHSSLPQVPFDLIEELLKPYESSLEVRKIIRSWVDEISSRPDLSADGPASMAESAMTEPEIPEGAEATSQVMVSDPETTAAWGFHWEVIKRGRTYWRIAWKIVIHNKTRGEASYQILIKFQDAKGLVLDDQDVRTDYEIEAAQQRQHSEYYLIHGELGEKLAGATAYVRRS